MFKTRNKLKYYLCYTAIFVVVCVIAFNYFYLAGKTFISTGDGIDQYYKALIYYGRYLRGIVSDLFVKHRLIIPQFDFNMAEGSDILSALYYTIGDPIALFVGFVPEKYVYLFYDLSIILRFYLSGIAFSELCFYTQKGNNYGKLAGSFAYIFSYWFILSQSKDIYFLNPVIYFPLVILGVEKILNKQKPNILIIAVFLSGISNFYFLFMIAILTVFYVVIRMLLKYGFAFKEMLKPLLQITVASLLGVLLAGITVIPVAYALLSNNRLSVDYGLHLFYPVFYYERLLTIFLSNDDPYWLCMGFASPCLFSTALSFKQFKKDKTLFVLNVFTLIMILFPVFGKILNGFSYVSNRWSFAISLLVGYTLCSKWQEFYENRYFLSGFIFVMFAWAAVFAWSRNVRVLIPIIIALFFLIVLLLEINKTIFGFDLKSMLLLGVVIFAILYNTDYVYSYRGRQRTNVVIDKEFAKNILNDNEADFIKKYNDTKQFYRYSGNCLTNNIAILENTNTTSYYFSIANPDVSQYRNKLEINEYLNFFYKEYDQRALPLTLANVRYYISHKNYETLVPYGFEKLNEDDKYILYKNNNALPFGYSYKDSVSCEYWDLLNSVEKQEVLSKAIVLDIKDDNKVDIKSEKVIFEIDNNNFDIEDNNLRKITFEAKADNEYYLILDKISFDDGESYLFDKLTDVHIKVRINGIEKNVEYHTNDYQFYNGKDCFTVYLGVLDQGKQEIELDFRQQGLHSFETFELYAMPVNVYDNLALLKQDVVENVVFDSNSFSGNIDLDEEKYVLFSIPYSKGWKAYVDGQKQDILKANEAYMALKLDKGSHEIEFRYHTPYLRLGILSSIMTCVCLGVLAYLDKKKIFNWF